jgi:uncharacterized membrane protein
MKKDNCGCGNIFNDWFYAIMVLIVGLLLLMINLGFVDSSFISFWPILIIIVGLKELMNRH